MENIELQPIGIARTPFTQSRGIPRQGGGPARVEVFAPFLPALKGLERCSHIWVLAFFDQADREVLQARPRKVDKSAPPKGVFSMRAPVRPNPLGLTCARILDLEGDAVVVDRLDFIDRTPVVDIKPYSPGWDLVPSASSAHRYDPSRYTSDELALALARDADNAIGPEALGDASLAKLVEGLKRVVLEHQVDLRDATTEFELGSPDARVDVLLCATGASFGNQRLRICGLPERVLARVRLGSGAEAANKGNGGSEVLDIVAHDAGLDIVAHPASSAG